MYGRDNIIICDINTIGFVLVSAQCACRVCDALAAILCNLSLSMNHIKRSSDSAHVY